MTNISWAAAPSFYVQLFQAIINCFMEMNGSSTQNISNKAGNVRMKIKGPSLWRISTIIQCSTRNKQVQWIYKRKNAHFGNFWWFQPCNFFSFIYLSLHVPIIHSIDNYNAQHVVWEKFSYISMYTICAHARLRQERKNILKYPFKSLFCKK